jgi:dolichol-phosphate mannosyltransferase
MSPRSLLIAIPCYNCAKQIQRVLADLFSDKFLNQIPSFDILLIDNQSTDDTVAAIDQILARQSLPGRIRFIKNRENRGLGGSQKVAFYFANLHQYDYLAVLHGDHQASASDLEALLKLIESRLDCSAVLGSRFSLNSRRIGYSKVRTLGNMSLNLVYSLITGRGIFDLGSGLNLFRMREIDFQMVKSFSNQFTFNMDLLLAMVRQNKKFVFCPITWTEFDQVSNARNIRVGLQALRTLVWWKLGWVQNNTMRDPADFEILSE